MSITREVVMVEEESGWGVEIPHTPFSCDPDGGYNAAEAFRGASVLVFKRLEASWGETKAKGTKMSRNVIEISIRTHTASRSIDPGLCSC
jgi:hypothetical protein